MNNDSSILPGGALLQGGKYKIIKVLGQGGFGITYLAEQTGLGMKVAIKEFFLKGSCTRNSSTSEVLVPVTDNQDTVSRCLRKFKSEARKIASLNNDHIVNIIDVFDENGTSYYVMKYLGGGSLLHLVSGVPMDEKSAVKIIVQICDALHSVHENGLLHLDIKPANIIFDERGRAVLIDFGVSKYVDSPQDSATTSSLVGFSRGYAPLEQINAVGSTLTPASDIYALGATLYHLVTGETPPDASVIMNKGLPALPEKLSESIKETIQEAMQPKSIDRPQDVDSFMRLLPEEAAAPEVEETTVLRVVSPGEGEDAPEAVPQRKSSKWPLFLSAAMLVGALVFFGLGYFRPAPEGPSGAQYEQLKAQEDALNEQIRTLEQKNSSLTSSNNSLSAANKKLQSENTSLQSEKQKLQSSNKSLQSQVDELQKRIQRMLNSR